MTKTRAEKRRLRERDDGNLDDTVWTLRVSRAEQVKRNNFLAYHDDPDCHCLRQQPRDDDPALDDLTRERAHDRNLYPCRGCVLDDTADRSDQTRSLRARLADGDVDPEHLGGDTPARTDGGTVEYPHYCDLCETGFETITGLVSHNCDGRASPDAATDGGENIPDGWTRETRIGGMAVPDDDYKGGYKCESCDHYIPTDHSDGTCPMCGTSGLIGTVIMGRQEVTYLVPVATDGGRPRLGRTKPCAASDCTDRIQVHADDPADIDAHYEVTRHGQRGDSPTGTSIYYHEECAPFGATNVPDQLDQRARERERGAEMRRELAAGPGGDR
jgi:hypothetical protein